VLEDQSWHSERSGKACNVFAQQQMCNSVKWQTCRKESFHSQEAGNTILSKSLLVTSAIIQTEALIHLSDLLCQEFPKEEATEGTTKENKLPSVQKRNKWYNVLAKIHWHSHAVGLWMVLIGHGL